MIEMNGQVQSYDLEAKIDGKQFFSIFQQVQKNTKDVDFVSFKLSEDQMIVEFANKSKTMFFRTTTPNKSFHSYSYMNQTTVIRNFRIKNLIQIFNILRKGIAVIKISQEKMNVHYVSVTGFSGCIIPTINVQPTDFDSLQENQLSISMTVKRKEQIACIARPLKKLKAQKIQIYYNSNQNSLVFQGRPKTTYLSAEWQVKVGNVIYNNNFHKNYHRDFTLVLKDFISGYNLSQNDSQMVLKFYPNCLVFQAENNKKWKLQTKVSYAVQQK